MSHNFYIEIENNSYKWTDIEPCPVECNGVCRECPKSIKYEVTMIKKKKDVIR